METRDRILQLHTLQYNRTLFASIYPAMAPLRRAYLLVGALLSVALYLVAFPSHTSRVLSTLTTKQQFDGGGHHVVLTTYPRWHEEVWLCLGGMLSDLGVPTSTYTECEGSASCIRYGLLDVAEKIGVWRGGGKFAS